jgi:hypothetical protein
MSVLHVQQYQLDNVWPQVEHFIADALSKGFGEMNASQGRYALVKGHAELFVAEVDGNITGAALVEFVNYPNYRIANVIATGGKGMVKEADEFRAWLKRGGASYIEGHCNDAVARLWESKLGMTKAYNVLRSKL